MKKKAFVHLAAQGLTGHFQSLIVRRSTISMSLENSDRRAFKALILGNVRSGIGEIHFCVAPRSVPIKCEGGKRNPCMLSSKAINQRFL